METLLETMRRLRAPDGCPWDREQTHESLRPYLLEEAAETADAIASGDTEAMTEELGDVLLQVAFHAVIAEEHGDFGYDQIEKTIVDKLIRRHPHVFADTEVKDSDEVVSNWHAIKAKEKAGKAPQIDVPHSLPALMRAAELVKKRNWETANKEQLQVMCDKLEPTPESIASLVLGLVSYARAAGINAEIALRDELLKREVS
ncbi:MAG: MazG family protein [Trueperaceae bacterium]|nr:MazG family protein [Trueperaceae bacterium]